MTHEPQHRGGAFRWSLVAAADRDWLRRRTEDVVTYAYRTACDLVRIGQILAEVRARVPWGVYSAWVASETPFSRTHAYRLIAVAEAFGAYLSQIETIEPCALYLLAQVNAPPAARELAVLAAQSGERVTRAAALAMLAAAKGGDEPGAADVRAYERDVKELELNETVAPPDDAPAAKSWRLFAELVETSKVVHVSKVDDPEDDTLYSVTCHRELDLPVAAVRRSLADAIAAAAGKEPTKHCPGCGAQKPVGEFGFDSSNDDGRNRYCKVCERERRKENRKAKKKRGAGPGAAPTP